MKEIPDDEKPVIICITETHLDEAETVSLKGYKLFRNDRNSEGGGVLIGVQEKLEHVVVEISRSKETDVEESIWVAINNGKFALRLGCIYAPQESRTRVEDLKTMYKNISREIKNADEKDQRIFICGDFNCKVGECIPNNKSEVTKGGKMLLNMVKKYKIKILNASTKCQGTWTRVEGEKRSILDYFLVKQDDEDCCREMVIDEERYISPGGFDKNDTWMVSDHNPLVCKMAWVNEVKSMRKKKSKIVTKKSHEKILRELEEKKIHEMWNSEEDLQTIYDKWSSKVEEIINKHSITPTNKNKRKVLKLLYRAKRSVKIRRKKEKKI